jgi:hypothetical protein
LKDDEERAAADASAAAAYGSRLARIMTAEVNPYATMCHDAVTRMIAAARGDGGGDDEGASDH